MATEMIVYFQGRPIRRRYLSAELRQSWAMGPTEYALYRHAASTRRDLHNTLVWKRQEVS